MAITTLDKFCEELLKHLDSLPGEERRAWGRDLVKWAHEREQEQFATAAAMGKKVWNVTANDADGKQYSIGWFIGRDGEDAIGQVQRMSAYANRTLSADEVPNPARPVAQEQQVPVQQTSPANEQDQENVRQPVARRVPFIAYIGIGVSVSVAGAEVAEHLGREGSIIFWLLVLGALIAHFKLTMR